MDGRVSTRPGQEIVLSINSGSSSLKFALFAATGGDPTPLAEGAVSRIGLDLGKAWLAMGDDRIERGSSFSNHATALDTAFALLAEIGAPDATLVGHRVVHGGPRHITPTRVDASLLDDLRALVPLAPLHLPPAILAIEAITQRNPKLPQVACFDTAFHAGIPELARRLPLPDFLYEEGVRRYGFHGLSYEYVMSELGPNIPARIVMAHLGNGASLVAVKDGQPIDTTMGLTPTGGILMGTRSGDLDPGVVVFLAREKGLSADALETLCNQEAGLKAIGGTPDMKTLLERAPVDARARLAVEMFCYAVRKAIGAFTAALGGIDLLVFTGGIGEHAAEVRAAACRGLEPFGIRVDPERNRRDLPLVSPDDGRCAVRVVPTNEDLMIARHAYRVVVGVLH